MAKTNVSLKIGTPEIRVGLDSVKKPKLPTISGAKKQPKSSMMKMVGSKKNPTFTNEASMPKNKKIKLPKRGKL